MKWILFILFSATLFADNRYIEKDEENRLNQYLEKCEKALAELNHRIEILETRINEIKDQYIVIFKDLDGKIVLLQSKLDKSLSNNQTEFPAYVLEFPAYEPEFSNP